jgi:hypothetical protein
VAQAHRADVESARWRVATTETVTLLATRPERTEHGRDVVAYLGKMLSEWSGDPVSPSARVTADRLRLEHRNRWADG